MSCILRISGRLLDVDKLVKTSELKPFHVYKKGDLPFKGFLKGKINTHSGASFMVSEADFEYLDNQIKDAIKYLTKNKTALKKLTSNKQVESADLDFAVVLKMGYNNIALQTEVFPHELLKLSGDLKINLAISLYPPDMEDVKLKAPKKKYYA